MRLIFKKPIDEKINKALNEAKANGKEVQEIVLTKIEIDELREIHKKYSLFNHEGVGCIAYKGIPITREEK